VSAIHRHGWTSEFGKRRRARGTSVAHRTRIRVARRKSRGLRGLATLHRSCCESGAAALQGPRGCHRPTPQNRCTNRSARFRAAVRASPMRTEIWRGGGTTRAKWGSTGRPESSGNLARAELWSRVRNPDASSRPSRLRSGHELGPRRRGSPHRVLHRLHRSSPHGLARGLRREHLLLLGERVDALPCRLCGLLHDHEFREPMQDEDP
jgi:hypothetical protein